MSRRKRAHAHANHERWLVSYADFITLLFAFFVVLYSSAQVDKRKMVKLATAIQAAFGEFDGFPGNAGPAGAGQPAALDPSLALEQARTKSNATPPEKPPSPDESGLITLQDELKQALQNELASHAVALHRESEGLVISLREFGFFDSGSATLKPEALPALDRIASLLAVRTCRLRVEGHTDNRPIHTPHITSNWELSTARSTEIVRLLVLRYRFAPERLAAAGYAQFHPVTTNDTAEGRAQNRRVDLVILGDQPAPSTNNADAKPSAAP
jgi:chemotaxis protein MotB